MINRTMANIDVKLGIKHICERIEQAYLKRSPVRRERTFCDALIDSQSADVFVYGLDFFSSFVGHSNGKTIIGGCE